MSAYFSKDEMRKQPDLLVVALVVTGQESPETNRAMLEDIFKRHITADPVARRLPRALLTKMVQPNRAEGMRNERDLSIQRYRRGVRRVHVPAFFGHRSQGQVRLIGRSLHFFP